MFRFFDKMSESSTTAGTGNMTLDGATAFDKLTFADAEGYQIPYQAKHKTQAEFEIGIGTILAGPRRLQRDVILRSSNSNNAVSFSSGNKEIFITTPAYFFTEMFGCFPSIIYQPPGLMPGSGIFIQGGQIMSCPEYLAYDLAGLSSVVLDCHQSNCFQITIDRTTNISFVNTRAGQAIRLKIRQTDTGGASTVTWAQTIRWDNNTAFTVAGSGKSDWLGFMVKPNGELDGFVIGKALPRD